MKEFVETIVKGLVDDVDAVDITEKTVEGEDYDLIEVKVAKDDMGRVIGKEGRIAKAIRTIVRAIATKEGKSLKIEIVE
ncbi:MAG: KH domain-containing protein [Clostridiales Family XIII bacterium]|jgi:predicted RNA-binding protein YlqC (UPF0109 family)|nr:KH domain-containing protein [Clostridiales Family XIII bacterium]